MGHSTHRAPSQRLCCLFSAALVTVPCRPSPTATQGRGQRPLLSGGGDSSFEDEDTKPVLPGSVFVLKASIVSAEWTFNKAIHKEWLPASKTEPVPSFPATTVGFDNTARTSTATAVQHFQFQNQRKTGLRKPRAHKDKCLVYDIGQPGSTGASRPPF
ncbi:hypothetical protein SPI_03683 [Niveomyces insectorum RCEF 264]|uniref:Secreted protein n=1 Tax=Niveomyces insectorum RCEF 264 TaxID=1081102 RepID=A0A162ML21_9HYPO|nr:hypothetical protein SPI_03683 [Niveomyces insectorum RCEF 264]